MTTIVYDLVTLAADGQSTQGHRITRTDKKKIHTPADGKAWTLFDEPVLAWAFSGATHDAIYFQRAIEQQNGLTIWQLNDAKLWPAELKLDVIAITPTQAWHITARPKGSAIGALPIEVPIAIGAGAGPAFAALHLGKNAVEAVEFAATQCAMTGGTITQFTRQEPITTTAEPAE